MSCTGCTIRREPTREEHVESSRDKTKASTTARRGKECGGVSAMFPGFELRKARELEKVVQHNTCMMDGMEKYIPVGGLVQK